MDVKLLKVIVKNIDFNNDTEKPMKLELKSSYSYGVRYLSGKNICRCELTAKTEAKGIEEKFHIHIVLEGIFEFDPSVKKETLHVETYDQLFPYLRSTVTAITANAGIAPVIPPYIDISKQNIYRVDMNKMHDQTTNNDGDDFVLPDDDDEKK